MFSFDGSKIELAKILPAAADVPQGAQFWITNAEQKALRLLSATSAEVDGYIGLSNALNWAWNQNVVSGSTQSDAVGALEHEISEVMGRLGFLDNANAFVPPTPDDYGPMDLYRFSSTGAREFTQGDGFFSLNDGATLLTPFNNPLNSNRQPSDWNQSVVEVLFGDTDPGVNSVVTPTDLAVMQALGWTQPNDTDTGAGGAPPYSRRRFIETDWGIHHNQCAVHDCWT